MIGQAGQAIKDTGEAANQANTAAMRVGIATEDTRAVLAKVTSELEKVSAGKVKQAFAKTEERLNGIGDEIKDMKARLDDPGNWERIRQNLTGVYEQKVEEMKKDFEQKVNSLVATRTLGTP